MSLNERDVPFLFLICGIGFASVSLVLALLYTHAYRKREELGLNDWERLVTRLSIADNLATMAVGLASAALRSSGASTCHGRRCRVCLLRGRGTQVPGRLVAGPPSQGAGQITQPISRPMLP